MKVRYLSVVIKLRQQNKVLNEGTTVLIQKQQQDDSCFPSWSYYWKVFLTSELNLLAAVNALCPSCLQRFVCSCNILQKEAIISYSALLNLSRVPCPPARFLLFKVSCWTLVDSSLCVQTILLASRFC